MDDTGVVWSLAKKGRLTYRENDLSSNFVNLDALIKRQDMGAGENKPPQTIGNIKHTELESGANTYNVLRKPDFQRETSIWTPEKVRDLIYAYVNEDLVPAVILWRSPSNDLFVIDGAHRLSSIVAWVNDDYGDGILSRGLFDEVQRGQKDAAKKTKELVEESVGPYKVIKEAFTNSNTPQKYVEIAKKLVNCSIIVQRLETPDVANAERSFFKINQQGVPLTDTEKTLLHSRNCPNAIAARAINQRGTGHPHWKKFDEKTRLEIEKLAQELYGHCFHPPLETSTVKTAVLPIAGKYHPAEGLELLLNTVNFANKVSPEIPKNKEEAEKLVPADIDGSRTIEFLKQTKRVITRMSNRTDTDVMRSLPDQGISFDHKEDRKHGGLASEENLAKTHHYCNSAKDMLIPYLEAKKTGLKPAGV